MKLHPIDIIIIFVYIIAVVLIGYAIAHRGSKNIRHYFLGGNKIPWWALGMSNASGMFDISGTMWTVTILFIYGIKSVWIPWLWPVWNQIFVMIFLAAWMRRSNVMTGAEWITTRFGDKKGGELSHLIVVVFALVSVLGFIAYFFEGIGKFAGIILPWDLSTQIMGFHINSQQAYATIIMLLTAIYVMKGGMYSVVFTEVIQFVIMTVAAIGVGIVALTSLTPDQIHAAVPENWSDLWFGWTFDVDWSGYLDSVNQKIENDGFGLFGPLIGMMVFKGIFASIAGPVPSFDMQRILSAKSPKEASKMAALTNVVLFPSRFLMIAGFAALGLVFFMDEFKAMGDTIDFEILLPAVIDRYIPTGLKGILLAGLLAAFMSTFAAFVNAAPAYLVNDIYKKYINPHASPRKYMYYSYIASLAIVILGLVLGFFAKSINSLTLWITSALYGGYAAANVLKWIWWRFNGYGYFWGMLTGLAASTLLFFFSREYAFHINAFNEGTITELPYLFKLLYENQIKGDALYLYFFPLTLAFSFLGCLSGTYFTAADDRETLKKFYKSVRPWGFWKPVLKWLRDEDDTIRPNTNFKKDMYHCLIGIIWQMTLVLIPVYLIIGMFKNMFISIFVLIITTLILKYSWWNSLRDTPE